MSALHRAKDGDVSPFPVQSLPCRSWRVRGDFLLLCSASAKLGEDFPALITRFGSNYQPVKPARWTDAAYKFESKNCQVEVALKAGHSVSEYYFCHQPLVNGKPSESIWRGIRIKNAPNAKWKPDGHDGLVSADGHFTTWFSTENLPEQSTCAIGINDYFTLKEGQLAAVPGQAKETSQAVPAQPDGKPVLPIVGGVEFNPVARKRYSIEYFHLAETEGKRVYAAKSYKVTDFKIYDYPSHFVGLDAGEPLHVISINPETLYLTVFRLRYNTFAVVSQEDVTIR